MIGMYVCTSPNKSNELILTSPPTQSLEKDTPSKPLPHRGAHPCRRIIFKLSSHDQGRGRRHENMYEFSWTWFDTEVIHGAHERKMYINGEEQEILDNERGQERKHYTEA